MKLGLIKGMLIASTLCGLSVAHAGHLVCQGDGYGLGEFKLTFEGHWVTDWMRDAKATVVTDDQKEVGRAKALEPDANYRPRKYKNFMRLDLTKLTNVKDFSKFYPKDDCRISFLLPKNFENFYRFNTPVIVNCEQSGGTMNALCVYRR